MNVKTQPISAPVGAARRRLLLIDDDPVASDILLLRIAQSCPLVSATAVGEPVAPPGYDMYVVDLNFAGKQEGVRLIESISATTPDADVFLLSSYLEVEPLKRAMGVNCAGAFDKRNPEDVTTLLRVISENASRDLRTQTNGPQVRRTIIGEMAALIREWNRRISAEQLRDG